MLEMVMSDVGGNLQQVRIALEGITGVETKAPAPVRPESYFRDRAGWA